MLRLYSCVHVFLLCLCHVSTLYSLCMTGSVVRDMFLPSITLSRCIMEPYRLRSLTCQPKALGYIVTSGMGTVDAAYVWRLYKVLCLHITPGMVTSYTLRNVSSCDDSQVAKTHQNDRRAREAYASSGRGYANHGRAHHNSYPRAR